MVKGKFQILQFLTLLKIKSSENILMTRAYKLAEIYLRFIIDLKCTIYIPHMFITSLLLKYAILNRTLGKPVKDYHSLKWGVRHSHIECKHIPMATIGFIIVMTTMCQLPKKCLWFLWHPKYNCLWEFMSVLQTLLIIC